MDEIKLTPEILGEFLKKELKERGTSQKVFAEAIGLRPSHLSEIVKGKRQIPKILLPQIASYIGLPVDKLLECQACVSIGRKREKVLSAADCVAEELLLQYDSVVCVKSLFKGLTLTDCSSVKRLESLAKTYKLTTPEVLSQRFVQIGNRCFRRSSKNGLDTRMISTWILKAEAQARQIQVKTVYDRSKVEELAKKLSDTFHCNADTLVRVERLLNGYGIGFAIVEKEEHASVDGYSFIFEEHPYIIITNRYKRIDNLAFTILHELGHIALGHTKQNEPMISVDERGLEDVDETSKSEKEAAADRFATAWLIPEKIWCLTPKVSISPFAIQKAFTEWAKNNNLNEWIVLGRVSHETGMYRFKSNDNRNIN